MMKCVFDNCELWNGILLGMVSSLLFAILNHYFRIYFVYKRTYGKIAGHYTGYGYKSGSNQDLDESPISRSSVKHIGENILEITIDHSNQDEKFIWVGEMRMNSQMHGRITYKYVEPSRLIHQIGIKDCIVSEDKKTIYLIDVDKENYGKEVFKRN